jgi:hypothetical protein
MKFPLSTILLASTMALPSLAMTATKQGHGAARTVSAPAHRTPRFLSEDEPASAEQENGSGGNDEGGSLDGGSSDGPSLAQRSFEGAPTERECEMCK